MALAILKQQDSGLKEAIFQVNIGTNKWYQIAFGTEKTVKSGFPYIEKILFKTPLQQTKGYNAFSPAFEVKVLQDKLPNEIKYAQLMSYSSKDLKGPSISRVVRLMSKGLLLDNTLPEIPSIFSNTSYVNNMNDNNCRSVSFNFSQPGVSRALFLNDLLKVVKAIAPEVIKGISSLTGGGSSADTNKKMVDIIQGIIDLINPQGKSKPNPGKIKEQNKVAVGATSFSYNSSMDSGFSGSRFRASTVDYSGQMTPLAAIGPLLTKIGPLLGQAAPMIGQLAPLLKPMLEQAPQLLKSMVDQPQQFLTLISEINQAQQKLQLESKKADQAHHEKLLAISNLGNLDSGLTKSLTAAMGSNIELIKPQTIEINGKPKFAYKRSGQMVLQVLVHGVGNLKQFDKGIFSLKIKSLETKKVFLEKIFRKRDIKAESTVLIDITHDELQKLSSGKDYLCGIGFRYLNKNKKSVLSGVDFLPFVLVDDYAFNSFGNTVSKPIIMADRSLYRNYWHKVWEGNSGDKKRWKIEVNSKYFIHYNHETNANGRIETKILNTAPEDEKEKNIEGKLKSGFELSPEGMNKMLPLFGKSTLSISQLDAMRTIDVASSIDSVATSRLKLKGKQREQGYIWVYPEVSLYELKLNRINTIDEYGAITSTKIETLTFPKYTAIHMVGEKSEKV